MAADAERPPGRKGRRRRRRRGSAEPESRGVSARSDGRVGGWAQVLQTRIAREATVLFIDIKGFTAGCAQMTVAQVTVAQVRSRRHG